MRISIQTITDFEVKFLRVRAGVRYWEDGEINGIQDVNGDLAPCRNGDDWEPIIEIETGIITNWKPGTIARVHYKVCDDGDYWLQSPEGEDVLKYDGFYVPSFFPGDHFGDYLILEIDGNGKIANWDGIAADKFKPVKTEGSNGIIQ